MTTNILITKELKDEILLKKLSEIKKNSQPIDNTHGISSDDADSVVFSRMISVQKGKWRILPKGIENKK